MSTVLARLHARLQKTPGGCWLWMGSTDSKGYGKIFSHMEGRKNVLLQTHRAAYALLVAPIPDGLNVLHRCDTTRCCNPDHLFLGTQADNMADKAKKGRAKAGPCSKSDWWNTERRELRAIVSRARKLAEIERKRVAAGAAPDTKWCNRCQDWLSRSLFSKSPNRSDGLSCYCMPCRRKHKC